MRFLAPYVLYGALKAPVTDEADRHVDGYRQLLEAIRDDRYDLAAAQAIDVVGFGNLPVLQEAQS